MKSLWLCDISRIPDGDDKRVTVDTLEGFHSCLYSGFGRSIPHQHCRPSDITIVGLTVQLIVLTFVFFGGGFQGKQAHLSFDVACRRCQKRHQHEQVEYGVTQFLCPFHLTRSNAILLM